MNIKLLGAFAAVALLAACAKPAATGVSTGAGATAMTSGPAPGSEEDLVANVGDRVAIGQHIGGIGTTGRSTGPHLHYEVWVDGRPQNPKRFLEAGDYVQQTG